MNRKTLTGRVIALDVDGVLLDYAAAYAQAWERAFGVAPALRNANAYWPMDRWQVDRLEGEALAHFRSFFDEQFWSSIPPVFCAQEACQLLSDTGFELICVTALDARMGEDIEELHAMRVSSRRLRAAMTQRQARKSKHGLRRSAREISTSGYIVTPDESLMGENHD